MDGKDLTRFSEWFDVLAVTHSKAFPNEDIRSRAKAEYFDVLRPYPVEAIQFAYESLRRKMKKWPVPADWLEALPPYGSTARLPPASPDEIAQNDEAERLGYEAEAVCQCSFCVQANCFLPPRYVPRLDGLQQVIERRHPEKQGRPILLGRWIHGAELKRWYAARAQFYELKTKIGLDLDADRNRVRSPDERSAGLVRMAKLKIIGNTAPVSEETAV